MQMSERKERKRSQVAVKPQRKSNKWPPLPGRSIEIEFPLSAHFMAHLSGFIFHFLHFHGGRNGGQDRKTGLDRWD